MKKSVLKVTSMLLLTGIVAGTLSGCKTKQEVKTSGNVTAGFHATGLPIVDNPVTLKVLTTRWGNMGDSFTKNQWLIDLEAKTNVKIEWQVESLNDWGTKKSTLLASGDLPDIIIGSQTFNDADILNNLSLFVPVDDLVKKYMPNYSEALNKLPELKKAVTFPDGKMYSFGKNLPKRPKTRNQPIINKTWLDRLGLKEPTNLDELYNVLLAFKTKDPNGNGKADEIPITGNGNLNGDLLNPFGITDINDSNMIVNNDGTLTFYPTSEQYKDGLKWLNKLYIAGIIDPQAFTQDNTMMTSKNQDPNAARVGFTYAWTPDADFGKWSSQYIAIAPIKGPDGKQYAGGDVNGVYSINRNEALITTNCKNPEIAARWIDEFYTGEASIQNFWGAIGTVINKNSDGTYTLNSPPAGTSADAWYWDQSLRDFGPKYVSADFQQKIKLSPQSGDGLKVELSKLADPYVVTSYPNVMYTNEENQELPTLTTDINTYVGQMRAQFVIKGGIDEGWDAYVKKLKDMGLEKLIKIRTDAYNRYQNVK
ncbi:extracellular solute-binding protein [Clostridium sp. SYSU_GA19001]|uniref:extracellular solute-binding protein n=1 Tax=Clostridium caldaquaticum TaxID=2940653 RepID=UPI002076E446|nr:extracellular solute-binding protein [Clostridium caldaquaticum]MCM8709842.1 extracellular solute-binding protein [Clostridium caldaquaticum]